LAHIITPVCTPPRAFYPPSPRLPKKFGEITSDWESQLPADLANLKTLLEFPHASDNISKMRQRYLAEGATPDHKRYGWIRALV
jgi:hypothetical protein